MDGNVRTVLGAPSLQQEELPIQSSSIKRALDLLVASALLVMMAPVMIAIAAVIYWLDGPPVLFAHTRVGRYGVPFQCLKFRTMSRNAEAVLARLLESDQNKRREWSQAQKIIDDPRVLGRVGRFLRRNSLDELPQVYNVLRGEMSVVGPRPIVPSELERYGEAAYHYLSAKPGLTGLWQVSGRNRLSYEQRVSLDVAYVEGWSHLQDLIILMKTPRALHDPGDAL